VSISLSRYINITSQVGAGNVVPTRDLIGRLFTDNNLLPPGTFLQFSNAADVGSYFGVTSEEYYRAVFYFGWVSKNLEQPQAIQFARWVPSLVTTQTGDTTSGMNTVANLQSTAGLYVGAGVSGSSIAGGTTIASITGPTSITLSINATGTVTGETLTFTSTGVAPMIFPSPSSTTVLADWTSITSGSFGLTIGGVSNTFGSLDFSAAGSLSAVASIIQTAIQAILVPDWEYCSVTYVPTGVHAGFQFVGGASVAATISVQPGLTGTDITGTGLLGWFPGAAYNNSLFDKVLFNSNAIWSSGALSQTITQCLTASASGNNNFGSFLFLNNLNITLAQAVAAATWNQSQNVEFLYTVPVTIANATNNTWTNPSTGLGLIGGCSLTASPISISLSGTTTATANTVSSLVNAKTQLAVGMLVQGPGIPTGTTIASIVNDANITLSANATLSATSTLVFFISQYPEMCPMMIEAATNYSLANSVQNYMFQVFDSVGLNPIVFDDSTANSLDSVNVNYYGQTQTAGAPYNYYQRGLMQGPASAPLDQNTYVNEIWLKDALSASLLQLLLNLNQLPANAQGQALALLTIQGEIDQALNNGSISVGKTLTSAQIMYITNITQDANAWYQVQNSGYWVDCVISIIPASSPPQYQAAYTLVYSKDDTIRFVSGKDILI